MALLEVLFGSGRRGRVGVLQFDAISDENHSRTVELTAHPVEGGGTISDHQIRKPDTLSFIGRVTNDPIAFVSAESPIVGDNVSSDDRVSLAYLELLRVSDAGERVQVFTTLRQYENMAIQSLNVERNADKGNSLFVNITLQEVLTAKFEEFEGPIPIVGSETSTATSETGTQPTPEAEEAISKPLLLKAVEYLGVL